MNDMDLNIDNYSINDLKKFLHLSTTYTESELEEKEKEFVVSIISSDPNVMDETKKYEIINFIKKAKTLLENNLKPRHYDLEDTVLPKPQPVRVGTIINPLSHAPSMQFSKNALPGGAYGNGYGNNIQIKNYIFNTLFRDNFFTTNSTNSTYTLPKKLYNVISLDLAALQFPNYIFTFSNVKKTTSIFIKEDNTNLQALVYIPSGNYNSTQMPSILEEAINTQVVGSYNPSGGNRFTVTINPYTYFTLISNTTNTFTMITNSAANDQIHDETYICLKSIDSRLPNLSQTRYHKGSIDDKLDVRPEQYYQSLGWLLGYRRQLYTGKKAYSSEGHFDNSLINYLYFVLRDYTLNNASNTIGILPESLLSSNILAVIPITSEIWTSTFDNNANFIYKTRNYSGPVNIAKISIQLLNPYGEEVNINFADFAFCLQATHVTDAKQFGYSEVPEL